MARADELEHDDRIIHPVTEQVVTVTRVSIGLNHCNVYFKARGQHGRFRCLPHTEIAEVP